MADASLGGLCGVAKGCGEARKGERGLRRHAGARGKGTSEQRRKRLVGFGAAGRALAAVFIVSCCVGGGGNGSGTGGGSKSSEAAR